MAYEPSPQTRPRRAGNSVLCSQSKLCSLVWIRSDAGSLLVVRHSASLSENTLGKNAPVSKRDIRLILQVGAFLHIRCAVAFPMPSHDSVGR
jgi:hypothetical protein